MNYQDMELDDLLAVLREHCTAIADIAHAMDKCFVVFANGKGPKSTWNVIDTDPIEEVARG